MEAIVALQPDILALQEVTITSRSTLRACLAVSQLTYILDAFELAPDWSLLKGPRKYGELIACRWPFAPTDPKEFSIPWSERVLSATIASPFGIIELHTTHIPPGSSNGLTKIDMLEGIFCRLAIKCDSHRILCGDFNTPREETPDGRTISWGRQGSRWDKVEKLVLRGLAGYDLGDVYRLLRGYGVTEFSHYSRGRGRRYDHVFASQSLRPHSCRYIRDLLDSRLSDHAPIEAIFQPINNNCSPDGTGSTVPVAMISKRNIR